MSDGNGFTGYNGSLATANIDAFREAFEEVKKGIETTFIAFTENLAQMWASPIAETFNVLSQTFMDALSQGVVSINSLINSAVSAVNSFARSNGSSFSYGGRVGAVSGAFAALQASKDGIIGMKIEKVRALLENFVSAIKGFIAKLGAIPASLAVYDPAGSIRNLYTQRINQLKTTIENSVNQIKDKINENITSEEDSITRGKASSQAALSA